MSHKTAVALFAGEANVDKENFIEELSTQRKNKAYTFNPITIKIGSGGGVFDNADVIKQGIALMRSRADEAIKNELSVENMELLKKEFTEVYEWLKATRTNITSGFDAIKSKYTSNEKDLKDKIIGDIDSQILKMKEQQFKIAETNIRKHLEILLNEYKDLGIGLDMFDSFIEVKRKTAGMLPSEKTGKTSVSALRTISDEFEKIAKPIRERIEADKRKDFQSKIFEQQIGAINVEDDIQAGIEALFKLEQIIDSTFPDIIDACKRSIKNKIEVAEANLRAKKSLEERDEAEKRLNASRTHDEPRMERVSIIKTGITTDGIEVLEDKLSKLREIHPQLQDEENKNKVIEIANLIKSEIKRQECDDAITIGDAHEAENHKKINQFGITADGIKDITFELQMMSVDAGDVAEARGEFLAKISEMFSTDFIKEL